MKTQIICYKAEFVRMGTKTFREKLSLLEMLSKCHEEFKGMLYWKIIES